MSTCDESVLIQNRTLSLGRVNVSCVFHRVCIGLNVIWLHLLKSILNEVHLYIIWHKYNWWIHICFHCFALLTYNCTNNWLHYNILMHFKHVYNMLRSCSLPHCFLLTLLLLILLISLDSSNPPIFIPTFDLLYDFSIIKERSIRCVPLRKSQ